MIQEYCKNCGRITGHKRAMGMGTLLGAICTFGVSLAATPFYPKRCVVCGCKREETTEINNSIDNSRTVEPTISNKSSESLSDIINRKIAEDIPEDQRKYNIYWQERGYKEQSIENDLLAKMVHNFLCMITFKFNKIKK